MYENNWESLNSRPVPEWFADAKFGIFIHWGLYSVPAYAPKGKYAEWYGYHCDEIVERSENDRDYYYYHQKMYPGKKYNDFVEGFTAELFDADKWADLFQKSGAKYINIVSKHHDGFCLYKTDYAWNWNSVDVGPHRDFLMELKDALAKTDVRFGVYHSVYEWFHPVYLRNPEEYALTHLIPMLKELVEKYQPATLFTDGEWEHTSDVWHSTEFLQWLYNESSVKDFIVPNDRWGKETRGCVGGNFTSEYGYIEEGKKIEDVELDRPFEECRGIGRSFGFNKNEDVADYLSAKELIEMLCDLVSKGGNFLLNIGPAADGTIPVIMEERLLQMGDWLRVNGEAIYGTRVYSKKLQNGVYYTKKGEDVYAIINRFPFGTQLLELVDYDEKLKAALLGSDAEIEIRNNGGKAELVFPAINPESIDSDYLYAFKLTK
ncbi:MAG: alpha-L-fucosidase [Clostridia bacterium]|nr:alpha-L-fucosidase [Clostridia bacterium]